MDTHWNVGGTSHRTQGGEAVDVYTPAMNYVERDGIWRIVTRTDEAEAVTVCNLRIVQQTYLWERQPSPLCSRCRAG